MKEIRRLIYLRNVLPFVFLNDGGELLGISDHQQLYSAEWLVIVTVFPQGHVHRIHQVCPDHRNFIDNQQVQCADDLDSFFS